MDQWTQRVQNSQAIREAREILTLIGTLSEQQHTADDQAYLERVDFVIGLTIRYLEGYDPRLLTEGFLNSLVGPLTNIRSYLNTWVQEQRPEYLAQHIQNMLDNLLTTLATLPAQDLAVAREALESLKRSVSGYRLAVDNETNRLETKSKDLQDHFDSQIQAANKEVSDLNDELARAEDGIEKTKTTNQTLTATQQTAFSTAETSRSESFAKLLTDKQKELDAALEGLGEDARSQVGKLKSLIEKDRTAAGEARSEIDEILGIVGERALVTEYAKSAAQDRGEADNWRIGTVILLSVALGFAVWVAITVSVSSPSIQEFTPRLAVTLTSGALATYAARQSSEHRRAQRDAQRMALQLAALKPYLKDIENKGERDKLLAKLAGRLFGQNTQESKRSKFRFRPSKEDPSLVSQLLAVVLQLTKSK